MGKDNFLMLIFIGFFVLIIPWLISQKQTDIKSWISIFGILVITIALMKSAK